VTLLDEALTFVLANTTGFQAGSSTGSTGTPIFLSRTPPERANTAVSFHEPGGAPPLAGLSSTAPVVERPRIQVLTRAPTYVVARANAQTIWDAFYNLTNSAIAKTGSTGTTLWVDAAPVSSVTDMGLDENDRRVVTANYQVNKEMS